MDFKTTLNLPLTDFPMKGDLPAREPIIQAKWKAENWYQASLEKPAPKGTFILHDGPPYSNGNIHLGHALNKTLKDFVVKYKTMQGFHCPYVPGWDNHGLPIEVEVMKEFRAKKEQWTPATLRARCRTFAGEWVETQKAQFERLGVRGDWDNPYLTMAPAFEARIVQTFAELAKKGYVYRGLKPVFWDTANETALANTEAEYKNHVSPAIYVKFPLDTDAQGAFAGLDTSRFSAVIWTTTPWTIPANLALAFHPDFDYVVAQTGNGDLLLVAHALLPEVIAAGSLGPVEIVRTVKGNEVEHATFRHPLPELDRTSLAVLAGDYITTDTGTGIVHTAPGHGTDDYNTGRRYNLPVLSVVDSRGRYTSDAGPFAGLTTDEANVRVPERLAEVGALLANAPYEHSYPHSPRAPYKPLLFRATTQWFVAVEHDDLRQKALDGIKTVQWFPASSETRITAAVAGRPDWTISRQRFWGVCIPVFYANGEPVMTPESLEAVVELVKTKGMDAWYELPPEAILPEGFIFNGVPARDFVKETDVLDVWFDSGSTSLAVLDSGVWPELSWPADVYLEGSDQHRGWFNSSLMIGTAVKNGPPYKQVITNGFTVDERGYKMSKSKGNTIDPLGIVGEYGADVLRLWVGSTEYQEDTRLGEAILKQQTNSYRTLRNTFRFLLGNLHDFAPGRDDVPFADMDSLDKWAVDRLQNLVRVCTSAMDEYQFLRATQAILRFCSEDLSAFYLDVLKDRLYTALPDGPERRSSQTAMHEVASVLCRLLAPILSHTCEEVWQYLPRAEGQPASVHLAHWPPPNPAFEDAETAHFYQAVFSVRDEFNARMDAARKAGTVNKSAEALPTVQVGASLYALLAGREKALADALIVPGVRLERDSAAAGENAVSVSIAPAPGKKCERSWFVLEDVGADPDYPTISAKQAAIVREVLRRA